MRTRHTSEKPPPCARGARERVAPGRERKWGREAWRSDRAPHPSLAIAAGRARPGKAAPAASALRQTGALMNLTTHSERPVEPSSRRTCAEALCGRGRRPRAAARARFRCRARRSCDLADIGDATAVCVGARASMPRGIPRVRSRATSNCTGKSRARTAATVRGGKTPMCRLQSFLRWTYLMSELTSLACGIAEEAVRLGCGLQGCCKTLSRIAVIVDRSRRTKVCIAQEFMRYDTPPEWLGPGPRTSSTSVRT
jgi:hypothetical protein